MKRNKLSEVHQTQFEDMAKDESKKAVEIIRFFKENYKITILPSKISLFRKNLGFKGRPGPKSVKTEKIVVTDRSSEAFTSEMIDIIKETRQANLDVFSAIRLELLKSRDDAFKMKKGLNI